MEQVFGKCPMGCGRMLFLGNNGHVTCSYVKCPDPSAVDKLLDLPISHVVYVRGDGWIIEHSLACRLSGMTNCEIHKYCIDSSAVMMCLDEGKYLAAKTGNLVNFNKVK